MIIDSQPAITMVSLTEFERQKERERLAQNILKKQIGLRALFHYHGTEDDARAAAALIEPSSVVMIEGAMMESDYASKRLEKLVSHANQQVTNGTYSESLHMAGKSIAFEFMMRQPPDQFSHAFFHRLFAKGCAVLPADHLNIAPDNRYPPDHVPADGMLIDEMLAGHYRWLGQQAHREQQAVDLSLVWMNQLADVDCTVPVYIAYGLAHRNSLVKRFHDVGIQPIVEYSLRPWTRLESLMDLQFLADLDKIEVRQLLIMHHLGQAGLLEARA